MGLHLILGSVSSFVRAIFHLDQPFVVGHFGRFAALGSIDWIGRNTFLAATRGTMAGCITEQCASLRMEKSLC